jgi:hypothetical protein
MNRPKALLISLALALAAFCFTATATRVTMWTAAHAAQKHQAHQAK